MPNASRCAICQPEAPTRPAIRRAHAFLGRVAAMLTEKNLRYGDSAANPLRVFSRAAAAEQLRVRSLRLRRGRGCRLTRIWNFHILDQ